MTKLLTNEQVFTPNLFNINSLLHTRDVLRAETSLYEFLKQVWPFIENGKPFYDSWHIHDICEHFQAAFRGEIKKLIVLVPPRSLKTTISSIIAVPWVWIHKPHEQFMYASYAASLSLEHSLKCRNVINLPWYKDRWGDIYKLCDDQNTKSYFANDMNGHRIATSVGAAVTGKGAGILIGDDLNSMQFVDSDAVRNGTNAWLDGVWYSRLNDPKTGVRIIIQQRGHYNDATGYLLEKDINKEWVVLNLPMRFEYENRCSTVVLSSTNGQVWRDRRTEEKELLSPERMPEEVVAALEREVGARVFAAQYQQRPSPLGGSIIKTKWFKWWKDTVPPKIEFVVQSWDTAYSKNETSSYSACTTWGVFYDQFEIPNVILLSVWRDRIEYHELRERAKRLYYDYRDTAKETNAKYTGRPVDMVLIEAKATGDPLIKDLRLARIPAIPFNPRKKEDKKVRAHFVTPIIEGGRVWLPAQPPGYNSLLPFAAEFLEAAAAFPSLESNDLIDTMTQALIKLKDGAFVTPPDAIPDPKPPEDIKLY